MATLLAFAKNNSLLPDLKTFLIEEPSDEYHAKAKTYMSSHQLGDFRRCPLLWYKKHTGQIQDQDRPAYKLGRAGHTLILEGREAYEDGYAVGGPINPKTGKNYGNGTKKFAEWEAEQGRPCITVEEAEQCEEMNAAVLACDAATSLLANGVAEGVVRATYCHQPCQIRIDWLNPYKGIIDLKTCDSIDYFERDVRLYGYVYQLAFYRSVLAAATGKNAPVYLVAIEKKQPYRCGVWRLAEEVLGQAAKENQQAMERWAKCKERNLWPTGYEEVRQFDCLI